MRIAIVGTELCAVDRRGGGLEQVLRRWAAGSVAAGHEVLVVSHRSPVGGDDPFAVAAVGGRADLASALDRFQPDLVSFHNRPQWASLAPSGSRAAITFHNFVQAWKLPSRFRAAPDLAVSAVSRALGRHAAQTLQRSQGGAHRGLTAATEHRSVTLLPPSIDDAYLVAPARSPERLVLSPNRLLMKKGVLDLLEVAGKPAFADTTFGFTDVISPWTRPTAEHRRLRAAIREVPNARLLPPASAPAELRGLYGRAAVVVCPVREDEGLGLVALEAQACGVPLVTTDLGGLREATFSPNECVPTGDLDALAGAIARAVRRSGQGAAARKAVLRRHSPAAAGDAYVRWVESLVS